MKPAAFLFDLDGTLVETEELWTAAISDMLASRGVPVSPGEILPEVVGRNWLDIDRHLHENYPVMGESSPEEDAKELRGFYRRRAADPSALVVKSSVEFFRKAARIAPCAIVSGSPHDDILEAARLCGIDGDLALALGAGEYEAGKPSPSGFLKAASVLGVAAEDCVVVEDSTVGVSAGVSAGMKVIALERRSDPPQDFSGCTWKVRDLSELDFEREFS